MCYYVASNLSKEQIFQLEHDYALNWEEEDREEFFVASGFDHPKLPVITSDSQFKAFSWGLIPSWAKDWDDAKKGV